MKKSLRGTVSGMSGLVIAVLGGLQRCTWNGSRMASNVNNSSESAPSEEDRVHRSPQHSETRDQRESVCPSSSSRCCSVVVDCNGVTLCDCTFVCSGTPRTRQTRLQKVVSGEHSSDPRDEVAISGQLVNC